MNRYFFSFILTLVLYTALVASYIYSMSNTKIKKSIQPKSNQTVKFTIIAQLKPIVKPTSKPKTKPIVKPKPKSKPIVKPKPKPIVKSKPKPVIKQKPIEKKKPEPKVIPKKIEKQVSRKTQVKKNKSIIKKALPQIDLKQLQIKQNLFYKKIKTTINKNKYYPRKAVRRGIEGNIEVTFTLLSDGNVKDIKIISGKSIFMKSAIKSIEKSFPIKIDKKLFKFPKIFTIKLNYILKRK